jgi:hypothetical protein
MPEEMEGRTRVSDEAINFWDRLPEISFCPELLEEFSLRSPQPARHVGIFTSWSIDDANFLLKTADAKLQRFARRGGPDISNLRKVRATPPFLFPWKDCC